MLFATPGGVSRCLLQQQQCKCLLTRDGKWKPVPFRNWKQVPNSHSSSFIPLVNEFPQLSLCSGQCFQTSCWHLQSFQAYLLMYYFPFFQSRSVVSQWFLHCFCGVDKYSKPKVYSLKNIKVPQKPMRHSCFLKENWLALISVTSSVSIPTADFEEMWFENSAGSNCYFICLYCAALIGGNGDLKAVKQEFFHFRSLHLFFIPVSWIRKINPYNMGVTAL